jgi:hypothetical protein
VPRLDESIEVQEAHAATAISKLAESVEQLCYHQEAQGLPPTMVRELHRAYRVLHGATAFYFGENSPLVWTAPDHRFKSKEKK